MGRPSFAVGREEVEIIAEIVARTMPLARKYGAQYDTITALMDLTACHANGCPLRLRDLLAAPDFDFVHDVFGIRRHIDRNTGKLGDCFVPRFAAQDGGKEVSR